MRIMLMVFAFVAVVAAAPLDTSAVQPKGSDFIKCNVLSVCCHILSDVLCVSRLFFDWLDFLILL